MLPNIEEFKKWYELLMSSSPPDYIPHLFPLNIGGKDPVSERGSWIADKNRLSFEEAVRFMSFGYNVGIAALSTDELTLVDVDNMEAIPTSMVKPTLSVMTRSRIGMHYFYFSNTIECNVNIPTEVGEIRSCNQFLVCCGSYVKTDISTVPDGQKKFCGQYTLHNEVAPVSITYDEFPKMFRDHKERIDNMPMPSRHEPSEHRSKSALFDLTITDVVQFPKNKARFASVFHGSDSGANTAVSDNLLHCWRHLVSHTPIQALAVMAGLYTCQQAGETHRNGGSGPSMVDLYDGQTSYRIWDYARRNGYISADDPPPSVALIWFAIEAGICSKDKLGDGWKLPSWAYKEARRLLRTNI